MEVMKKTLIVLIFTGLLCSYNISFADIYKYTDAEGITHLTTKDSEQCKIYNCEFILKEKTIKKNNVRDSNQNKSSAAVLGTDYLLKRGEYVYDSEFQIEHLISLDREAGIGYINDQLEKKIIIITAKDETVRIIDSCSFCQLGVVKVKAIDGKGSGWVLKSSLMKVKSKNKK